MAIPDYAATQANVSLDLGGGHRSSETPDFDITRPHPARMYDFYLGGKDHWAADREAAEKILILQRPPGSGWRRSASGRAW